MKINVIKLFYLGIILTACIETPESGTKSKENSNVENGAMEAKTPKANDNRETDGKEYLFKGKNGVVEGTLVIAQQGDYRHIAIRDSLGYLASFYVGKNSNITEQKFYDMEDGLYDNEKVRVFWSYEDRFIKQVGKNESIVVVDKIEFLNRE